MIQVFGLEKYVKTLEDLEIKYYPELREQKKVYALVNSFDKLSKLLPTLHKKSLAVFQKNITAMKSLGGTP